MQVLSNTLTWGGASSRVEHYDASAWTAGGHLFVHVEDSYWWADGGLGYLRAAFDCTDPAHTKAIDLFEVAAAAGLRVPLGKHMALRAGIEVGTELLVFSWRAQVSTGFQAHF